MSRAPELLPGRDGRWLVRDGRRLFVVPAALARRLAAPGGQAWWRALVDRHPGARSLPLRRGRGLWLRLTLLPGPLVRAVARRLTPLAATPALIALALAGLAGLLGLPRPVAEISAAEPLRAWLPVLATFLATALAHELGHAAALIREGWPPGSVGVGLLWVLPVGWCDVSAVALLDRGGRARVDLAGVAFQLAAGGLAMLAAGGLQLPAVALGAWSALAAVAWSLLPLARSDGYWLICDLLGLPDLTAPLAGDPGPGRRRAAALWRAVTALLLLTVAVALPWRLRAWLDPARTGDPSLLLIARAVLLVLLLVGAARTLRRVILLLAAAAADLRAKSP